MVNLLFEFFLFSLDSPYPNSLPAQQYLISEISFAVTNKKYFTVSKWENVVINSTNGNLILSYGNNMGNLTSVKSWRSAMLYADYNSAVMAVENEQSSQEEVSMRSFE